MLLDGAGCLRRNLRRHSGLQSEGRRNSVSNNKRERPKQQSAYKDNRRTASQLFYLKVTKLNGISVSRRSIARYDLYRERG